MKPKPEKKSIPNPSERQTRELTDLPEEFVIADIGDLFEKEGYDRKLKLSLDIEILQVIIFSSPFSFVLILTSLKKEMLLARTTNSSLENAFSFLISPSGAFSGTPCWIT